MAEEPRTDTLSALPRTPAEIPPMSLAELFSWFQDLSAKEAETLRAGQAPPSAEVWTQLAVQARLEAEIVATRWVLVAHLLRAGSAESWQAVASALSMPSAEAAQAEFVKWITSQVDLHQRSEQHGLRDDTAFELREMAHALPLGG